MKPDPFCPDKMKLFPEIRSVIRAMDYYMEPELHKDINFRMMILFSYINFFIILLACAVVPPTNKAQCGEGLFWRAHMMMWVLLFFSFLAELFLFYHAIPKDIFFKILESAKGDLREKASIKWAKFLAIAINSWFFVSGFIAKADLYTDVSFALEAKD